MTRLTDQQATGMTKETDRRMSDEQTKQERVSYPAAIDDDEVERVARAIAQAVMENQIAILSDGEADDIARAAIAAMRPHPDERVEVLREALDTSVTRLCNLHRKMLAAIQAKRPYTRRHAERMASLQEIRATLTPETRLAELEQALREAEKAVARIVEGDGGMEAATVYRDDGKPSKHDRCAHGHWMYEGCDTCADAVLSPVLDCIRAALSPRRHHERST